jgi:hypothetical protein
MDSGTPSHDEKISIFLPRQRIRVQIGFKGRSGVFQSQIEPSNVGELR